MKNTDGGDEYWQKLPFYRDMMTGKELVFESPVTFFAGENGSGKSTLIEAIAVAMGFNAEGGSRNFKFSTRNTTSNFSDELRLNRGERAEDGFFLRAESFYNVATNIEDIGIKLNRYGGESLHLRSHGESFMALVQNRFGGRGLYILDEPEAALSPLRQMSLLIEIDRLVREECQFLIATHSPILLSYPGAVIYELDEGLKVTPYGETEQYLATKDFLNNPEGYLKKLGLS